MFSLWPCLAMARAGWQAVPDTVLAAVTTSLEDQWVVQGEAGAMPLEGYGPGMATSVAVSPSVPVGKTSFHSYARVRQ